MYRTFLILLTCLVGFSSAAMAQNRGTMDEAKQMAERGAEYLKQHGLEKAAEVFMDPSSQEFRDKDLYVFVFEKSGVSRAFPPAPKTVGRDASALKDVDGKFMVKEFISAEEPKWVDYRWQNPQTKAVEQKSSYVIPVESGGTNYVVGVGAYKEN